MKMSSAVTPETTLDDLIGVLQKMRETVGGNATIRVKTSFSSNRDGARLKEVTAEQVGEANGQQLPG